MLGEFYTGSGTVRFLVGECCVAVAPSVCPVVGVLPPPVPIRSLPSLRSHPYHPVFRNFACNSRERMSGFGI